MFDDEVAGLERGAQAAAFVALLELIKRGEARAPQDELFAPIRVGRTGATRARRGTCRRRHGGRGVSDDLVACCEALLFVAAEPLDVARAGRPQPRSTSSPSRPPWASSTGAWPSAARASCSTARDGRYGLRAAPGGPAEAASRLQARAPERGLSPAALEALAVVAYLQPIGRPEIARIRGVSSDAVVAGLLERELIEEAGRGDGLGTPVLYRTTTTFERIFGLEEGVGGLPGLDGYDELEGAELRQRLHAVAAERG